MNLFFKFNPLAVEVKVLSITLIGPLFFKNKGRIVVVFKVIEALTPNHFTWLFVCKYWLFEDHYFVWRDNKTH